MAAKQVRFGLDAREKVLDGVQRVREEKGGFGFNAQTEKYEDLVQVGVIDPTKVVRTAIENAASIASLLLTTEALVAEIPEEEKAPAGAPHGDDY